RRAARPGARLVELRPARGAPRHGAHELRHDRRRRRRRDRRHRHRRPERPQRARGLRAHRLHGDQGPGDRAARRHAAPPLRRPRAPRRLRPRPGPDEDLMTTQYVTFTHGENLYGIGVGNVQEVLPFRATAGVPLAPADVAGLVNLRGQVVLALDLRTRLGLPQREDAEPMMVVVKLGQEPVSLLVDAIGDVAEVDDEQFEAPPQTLSPALREVIRGAYKLDGRLLLALDVDAVTAA